MPLFLGAAVRAWPRNSRAGLIAQSLGSVLAIQLALLASGIAIARDLGPAGRGEATIVLTLPTVVMQLVCLGFPSALTYYIARQPAAWSALARRVVLASLVQTSVGAGLLLGLDAYFLAGKSPATHTAGLISMLSLPFLIFAYYMVHIVQGLGDIRWFNILRVGSTALYSGGIFGGALVGLSVLRCAIVWTASQALLAAIAGMDLARRLRMRPESGGQKAEARLAASIDTAEKGQVPSFRTIANFALAGFLAQISPVESFRLDTLAVAMLFPSRIVGYYTVANSVTNAPLFAADAIAAVGYPHVASHDGDAAVTSAKRYMKLGALLCASSGAVLLLTLPILIPWLFGRAYLPSVGTGELLACAAAVMGLRRIGNDCLRALGKPFLSTRLEIVTLVVLGAGLATIGSLGSGRGVALSVTVAAGVGVLLFWRLLRRHEL